MQNLPKIVVTSTRALSLLMIIVVLFSNYFLVYYQGELDTYFVVTDNGILATFIVLIIIFTLLNILMTFLDNLSIYDSFLNALNMGIVFSLFIILFNEASNLYFFLMDALSSSYYLATSLLPFIIILFVFVLQVISLVYSIKDLKVKLSNGKNISPQIVSKKFESDPYDRLGKLKQLLDTGTISEDEFQIEKLKILKSI